MPGTAAATLQLVSMLNKDDDAGHTSLLEESHRLAVEVQYIFIDKSQRMTHVWLVLKICLVLSK